MSRDIGDNSVIDLALFNQKLDEEFEVLSGWFSDNSFSPEETQVGFEIEYVILDKHYRPEPINLDLVDHVKEIELSPECDACMFEVNTKPTNFEKGLFRKLHTDFNYSYQLVNEYARTKESSIIAVGTLANLTLEDYAQHVTTGINRYQTYEDSVPPANLPYTIHCKGETELDITLNGLTATCCAFQLHLRVGPEDGVRYYNSAIALTAPLLAVACNSPYLAGQAIWAESRILYFEKIFDIFTLPGVNEPHRCEFNTSYVKKSLLEVYQRHIREIKPVLPAVHESDENQIWHLQMHNSTIYPWVRPVIDYDINHEPFLRIEFRPLATGPTHVDMVANSALVFGAILAYGDKSAQISDEVTIEAARDNFYQAARFGLDSTLIWRDKQAVSAESLLLDEVIPNAAKGLAAHGIDADEIDYYLGIIKKRVLTKQTGDKWQRAVAEKHKNDINKMVSIYLDNQLTERPVHSWEL